MPIREPVVETLPLGMRCYALRGDSMIPMIPADQLPFHLLGVPLQLELRQMSVENWQLLRDTDGKPCELAIQGATILSRDNKIPSTQQSPFLAPDHTVRQSSPDVQHASMTHCEQHKSIAQESSPSKKVGQSLEINPVPKSGIGQDFDQSHSRELNPYDYHTPYPSGIEPDHTKKEYCTHWIKTGECAWLSIGCKFKHEMPDKQKLQELGFNQEPRWWKEKARIDTRGLTWMQQRLESPNNQLDQEPPAPRLNLTSLHRARKRMSEDVRVPMVSALPAVPIRLPQAKAAVKADQHIQSTGSPTPPIQTIIPNLIDLEDIQPTTLTSVTSLPPATEDHSPTKPRATFASLYSAHKHIAPSTPPISPIPPISIIDTTQHQNSGKPAPSSVQSDSEDDRQEELKISLLRKKQAAKNVVQKRGGLNASKYANDNDMPATQAGSGNRKRGQGKSEKISHADGHAAQSRCARSSRTAKALRKTPTEG